MTVVKCDRCGKAFVSGYTVLVRPVSHSRFPEANVAINQNSLMLMDHYDVCTECMHGLLEEKVDEQSISI